MMMRISLLSAAVMLAMLSGCETGQSTAGVDRGQVAAPVGMLRHVVHFKYNEDVTEEQKAEVVRAFAALPEQIETIRGFEYGETDISVEGLHRDFDHCFIVTFDDIAGLEHYGPHPAHEAFVEMIGPMLDEVFVVDYYARVSPE